MSPSIIHGEMTNPYIAAEVASYGLCLWTADTGRRPEVPLAICELKSDSETMPCVNLSTNVSLEGVNTSAILSEVSSSVAKIIGKPEAYVMVVLKGSVPVSFGGTEEPAAYGELVSIGGLNSDTNKKLSAAVAAILQTKLDIPKSRFYLKFYDTKGSFFGWNGSTF